MNVLPLKTAVRYVGGWGLIAFFVALLSFIFSFLGTIMCAALAGMMTGAVREARVFCFSVSLIFPGVIFTLLRVSKADLSGRQISFLALISLAAFWFAYAAGALLLSYERKGPTAGKGRAAPSRPPAAAKTAPPQALACLDGKWWKELAPADGEKKVLEIRDFKLKLSRLNPAGQATILAVGTVRLESREPLGFENSSDVGL